MRSLICFLSLLFVAPAYATNCLSFKNGYTSCTNGLSGWRMQDNTYWNNGVIQYDYPSQGKSYYIGEPYPRYDNPMYDPLIEDEDKEDCLGLDCR